MATRIEFGNSTAITVAENPTDVREIWEGGEQLGQFTIQPKKNPSEAQQVTVGLDKILFIREAHVDGEHLETRTPSSGLGVGG